jgi:hypothetical protein
MSYQTVRMNEYQRIADRNQTLVKALDSIVGLIGNIDHAKGHGDNAARMRGELLNDIRTIAATAVSDATDDQS